VPDIGNTLREARIRKGLTIKDVEAVTKIRSKYLEALEQDDFPVLPGPTFVTAFLRNYATFLKVDAEALVDEYKRNYEPHREEPTVLRTEQTKHSRSRGVAERQKRKTRRSQRGYVLVSALAIIVVIVLVWWGTDQPRP
jgi:cytoskeleton protein RodZ